MADFTNLDVIELADLIATKKASPVEVASEFLARIEKYNERLNAFVTVDAESTLVAAREREAVITRTGPVSRLDGIPIAHKDLYATAGMRTTGGSKVLADNVPDADATVVAALRRAGMVTLGKTNTHEFAYGTTNENSIFGPVGNPWDLAKVSGGSSGGSAAAVAGRLAPLASGSDTGGSIRMPAACCGITGLKPTYGRISRHGILPLCWTMDHPGPLARSAKDAALFLQMTAGYDERDAASSTEPVPDYLASIDQSIAGIRIGVVRNYFFDRTQESIVGLVEEALDVLRGLGAEIVDVEIEGVELSAAAALAIYLAEASAYHEDWLDSQAEEYTEQVRTALELGDQLLAKDYLHAQRCRTLIGNAMSQAFKQVDVFATPGLAVTATPIGDQEVDVRGVQEAVPGAFLRNAEPFDLTGLPALNVPCGFAANGMPASLQLAGPVLAEAQILRVGHAYQTATDWHRQFAEYETDGVER